PDEHQLPHPYPTGGEQGQQAENVAQRERPDSRGEREGSVVDEPAGEHPEGCAVRAPAEHREQGAGKDGGRGERLQRGHRAHQAAQPDGGGALGEPDGPVAAARPIGLTKRPSQTAVGRQTSTRIVARAARPARARRSGGALCGVTAATTATPLPSDTAWITNADAAAGPGATPARWASTTRPATLQTFPGT